MIEIGSPAAAHRHELTPVQRRVENIPAARVVDGVPTGLHDIDLPALGPLAVYRVRGHHPDRRPYPVASRQLGLDLDASVPYPYFATSVDPCGTNGIDHVAQGRVRAHRTGRHRSFCAGPIRGEVQRVSVVQPIGRDRGRLICEGRDNMKTLPVHVYIRGIGGGPVE